MNDVVEFVMVQKKQQRLKKHWAFIVTLQILKQWRRNVIKDKSYHHYGEHVAFWSCT